MTDLELYSVIPNEGSVERVYVPGRESSAFMGATRLGDHSIWVTRALRSRTGRGGSAQLNLCTNARHANVPRLALNAGVHAGYRHPA